MARPRPVFEESTVSVFHPPFASPPSIRSLADIERLEAVALDTAVPVKTTYEIFCNSAHAFGDKTALAFLHSADPEDEPVRWSYRELLAGIHQTANALHRLGVGSKDTIAVLLPACLDYHLALWGGEAAGVVQPLNPMLSDEKMASLMNAAHAKVLIAWGSDDEGGMWSQAMRMREAVPTLTTVLRVAPLDEAAEQAPALPEGVLNFAALRAAERDDRLESGRVIAGTDIAALFHTGGTTGAPKLARHSHQAQVFSAWAFVTMQGIRDTDVSINGYPLFHVAGAVPGSLASLSAGVTVVIPTTSLLRNRDVMRNYWRLVDRYKVTSLSAVPTVLAALANVPLDGADISTIRHCRTGAAVLAPELAARFKRLFGLHVHETLGMTEMAGVSTITPPGVEGPAGCVGFRVPYSRLRIVAVDDSGRATDRDLPTGETGMILFKSPNVFSGFLDPQDNAEAFTQDGWLATGDLGWLDSLGRLNISGRSKDLIIRSGHNIDPKVIEDALSAHPAVQLCAAVGAPDAYAGELPVGFVTLVPGASVEAQELVAFTAERVDEGPSKPKAVYVIDDMPLTNVGKIFKPELRVRAAVEVVRALVRQLADRFGLDPEQTPLVKAGAEGVVHVVFDALSEGWDQSDFCLLLKQEVGKLPWKSEFRSR